MKPFDLERALAGDPVVTRDGRPVKVMPVLRNHNYYPVVGFVRLGDVEYVELFTLTGKWVGSNDNSNDLFMASVKHEGWVNIYPSEDCLPTSHYTSKPIYGSEAEAKARAASDCIAIVKIEWED